MLLQDWLGVGLGIMGLARCGFAGFAGFTDVNCGNYFVRWVC